MDLLGIVRLLRDRYNPDHRVKVFPDLPVGDLLDLPVEVFLDLMGDPEL
tara:strand:+ start:146 stop:292 length:147 start_codon:yes stop_codon:yes gene_type:complete